MGEIRIIEKAKGMEREGAIELLIYHQQLQERKMWRLKRQLDQTLKRIDAISKEVKRRGLEDINNGI